MDQRTLVFVVFAALIGLLAAGAARLQETQLPGARPVINALHYSSLQAALDAVNENGGMVQIPAGTFEISEPLVIQHDDVTVHGAGSATHIVNTNTDGKPAIIVAHSRHGRAGNDRQHELWRIRLADFRVTGTPLSGHGIEAFNVNEILVDGVTISYHGGDGLKLSFCYEDPRVVDSLFTYNKQVGVNAVGCHDIVVAANQFEENLDGLHCIDGFNLCMTGNCLDDHLGRGVVIENTYGSVVSGNMIEECQAAALVMDRDCYGNTVSANVIAHNGAGVDLRDAHGCSVSANTFTIMKTDAVRVGAASGRIALSGNCFSDSYVGEQTRKRSADYLQAAGLVIDGDARVLVGGNAFGGIRPRAITMQSANESVVSGNDFVDTESPVR